MAPRNLSNGAAPDAPTGGTASTDPSSMVDWSSTNLSGHGNPQMWSDPDTSNSADGQLFAGGGAIEEDTNGSPQQDAIMKALSTVDGVLAFGRKLHGLGEGDGGAIKGTQVAGRMPPVPGTPSDSGVRQPQPMPGPLPPTSNPFGKRVSENQQDDQGDQGDDGKGAIDTEEETA